MKPRTRAVLNRLLADEWVSGNELFQVGGTRYGARLFELKHEHGIDWEKRPAPNGSHVPQYRLVREPEQQTLRLEVAS